MTEKDGSTATRAGAHPFALTATATFNAHGSGEDRLPDGDVRDLRMVLPLGLVGTPALRPGCSHFQYVNDDCPLGSALGTLEVRARVNSSGGSTPVLIQAPVYNLDPVPGVGAELGVRPRALGSTFPLIFRLGVETRAPYSLAASVADVPQALAVLGLQIVLWGSPADPAHDPYRGECASSFVPGAESFEPMSSGSCPLAHDSGFPLLSKPTFCSATTARIEATSWSSDRSTADVAVQASTGCSDLPFEPSVSAAPTSRNANSPTGLDLGLEQPAAGLLSSDRLAEALIDRASFSLAPGITVNPPAAAGLGYCSSEQLSTEALNASSPGGCPTDSEIGAADVRTPLVDGLVHGSLYLAEPSDPFDGRFALYLVLRNPERGIFVVQPIQVSADPVTGQLAATVTGVPKLPLERVELHIDSGSRGPLATPHVCGKHSFTSSLEPSSGNPAATGVEVETFSIDDNCPDGFRPKLDLGAGSRTAGSPTNVGIDLSISSSEPSPAAIRLELPKGIAADFRAVPTCSEASVGKGGCSSQSRIGSVRVAVGAGPEPLWVPAARAPAGDVFLAGPYEGAPYSLLLELPANAGLFDLGRVVLRAPLSIDPASGRATIEIGDIPQILAGIPLRYREIRVDLDRPGFLRNPTSCAPGAISGTATSATDGTVARLRSRFQATGCKRLRFKPRLAVGLSGALARNGHPALRAVLRTVPDEAGIAAASFTTPSGELLDFHHLPPLCPRRLPAGGCSDASRFGQVRLFSPFLSRPLAGPIFLREPESGLPGLLADLRGGGIHLSLQGHTSASGGTLRFGFQSFPDFPISKAVITLPGGPRGLLVNSKPLCGRRPRAVVQLSGQNGRQRRLGPALKLHGRC